VKLNLTYRWFCRLSISDAVPDHSAFSKNRHGQFRKAEASRFVLEKVLKSCINEGLVGGEVCRLHMLNTTGGEGFHSSRSCVLRYNFCNPARTLRAEQQITRLAGT